MARQWGQSFQAADGIFHYPWTDPATGESGEELSYEGPTGATQQPQPVSPTAPSGAPGSTYLYPGTPSPSWWNAPSNPWSIVAGTSEQGYGWGVPGFGQDPIKILTEYLPYLQSMTTGERGGYIPGSGTLNNFRLDQPGLLTNILGQQVNARYGQGGTGDPTTGREPQTPQEWLAGPKAFSWEFNMGQTPETKGLDYIANLFGRPDAGTSGISTAAWSAPQQYWAGLADAVQKGLVKTSPFGLKALAAKGFNVQPPGGAVDLGGGGGGGGGQGGQGGQGGVEGAYASIIAMQQAQLAAQIAYQEWQMRTGDEGIAMEKAQQAWSQKFQEVGQAFAQRATTAGITGQWDGAPTMAYQQQQWSQGFNEKQLQQQIAAQQQGTALNLLQLGSQLRGPQNYAQYLQTLGQTPQGLRDLVGGLAGQYNVAGSTGAAGPTQGASLGGLTQDLLSGGNMGSTPMTADRYRQETSGLPSPNQINLRNWGSLTPTGQSLALNAYESQGWDPNDVQKMLAAAAPRYTGPGAQTQVAL